jgi:hypothetical protein
MANLLQIQDDLKTLPNDPRTMQMLASYANGANPMVPPYLALGELNRRKQLMEKQQMEQAGQPPQGTVKDQVEQQAGLMALQQQPQGMPQGMPQMNPAGGGLLDLIAAKANAPRMGSGGIVAFARGEDVEGDEDEDEDEKVDATMSPDEAFAEAIRGRRLAQQFVKKMGEPPTAETPMAFRERLIKENPEKYGYLAEDGSKEVLSRLDELQAAKREELAKQREESERMKPGVLQLLAQQAMQTGGMSGRQALARMLGGYGQAQMGADAKAIEREQGIRAQEIKLQEDKMLTINKVQELKRARDEGDIKAEQKALMDLAKIAKDHNTTVGNLIGKVVSASSSMAGRLGAAKIGAEAKIKTANISAARAAADRLSVDERVAAKADRIATGKEKYNGESGPAAAQAYVEAIGKSAAARQGVRYSGQDKTFEREVQLQKLYTTDPELKSLSDALALAEMGNQPKRTQRLRDAIAERKKELAETLPQVPGKQGAPAAPAGDKVMTMADVKATAQKHGKTEAEVIAAAKAKGFTINP